MTRFLALILTTLASLSIATAQGPVRGSIVEDRAAKKLLEAGDARFDADETEKALEVWRSVIERYPRSKMRFDAHMRLGGYLLEKKRAFDEARGHFEASAVEANGNPEQRAEATLKTGVCFYEGRHYGQCFKLMRSVIEDFPTSGQVNQAYYHIGLGHFKLGHYSRAIEALEKVGTALSEDDKQIEKVEAGQRLFVKVDDQDLAILEPGQTITVVCKSKTGDEEKVECHPIGRQVKVVLGSIPTSLGVGVPGNGRLEVRGGDEVEVHYIDSHTADRKFDQPRLYSVAVVGSALAQITDGSFDDTLAGVVIGKQANLQVIDADLDRSDNPDTLNVIAEIWREKSTEELDAEMAALAAEGKLPSASDPEAEAPEIERYKKIDQTRVKLTEIKHEAPEVVPDDAEGGGGAETASKGAPSLDAVHSLDPAEPLPGAEASEFASEVATAGDPTFHSGKFRGNVAIESAPEPKGNDAILQAQPGDLMRLRYKDEVNLSRAAVELVSQARCIEGNLGNVRVTKTDIANSELKIKTQLGTAQALTNIGNHYTEFGLVDKAELKYEEALAVAEEVLDEARKLGGSILESAYVQLWRTYFAMGDFRLAVGMSQRLMREFPNSTFVDEAMLQQAQAFRSQGKLGEAIQLFQSVLRLNESPLKGEAQFGVAETYEEMAKNAASTQSLQLYERSFVEYQKVYEQFPDSGRVGDAVAKMANFYYQKKDYARAVDVFENVLTDYPDANFLDVILFNYGRCLYRLKQYTPARQKFDQLINEFPESKFASDAKKISDALVKKGL